MVYIGIYDIHNKTYVYELEPNGYFPDLTSRGNFNTDWSMAHPSAKFISHHEFYDLAIDDIDYAKKGIYDHYELQDILQLEEFIQYVQNNFNDETKFKICLMN